nr:hypothetical protein [Mariniradius sediminis]
MPLAFPDSIQLYEICTNKIKQGINKVFHEKFDRKKPSSLENRLKLCVNIAIAIHCIHETGTYVFVDLKPQNVLIDPNGRVSIVDLDSLQVSKNSNIIHHGHVATPEYTPFEGSSLNPSINYIPPTWDYFSMAVIFYEIIFGLHPYVATSLKPYEKLTTIQEAIKNGLFVFGLKSQYLKAPEQHDNFKLLPSNIQKYFIDAFDKGNTSPLLRPSAQDWGKVLAEEVANETDKVNIKCPVCGNDTNFSRHRSVQINCIGCNSVLDIRKGNVFGYTKEKIVYQDRTVYKDKEVVKTKGSTLWKIISAVVIFILFFVYLNLSDNINTLKYEIATIQNLKEDELATLRTENSNLVIENGKLKTEVNDLKDEIRKENSYGRSSYFSSLISVDMLAIFDEEGRNYNLLVPAKGDVTYIYPVLEISYPKNFSFPKEVDVSVKFIYPDGSLSRGTGSSATYTYTDRIEINGADSRIRLSRWGKKTRGDYTIFGDYKIEIWINNQLKASTKFTIF